VRRQIKVNRAFEKHFVALKRVLAECQLEKGAVYSHEAEADLQEILSMINALAARTSPPL
jgi:hypothetical protein